MSSQNRQTPKLAIATVYGRTRYGACRSAASLALPGPAASIADTRADALERSGFECRCGRQPGDCVLGGSANLLAVSAPAPGFAPQHPDTRERPRADLLPVDLSVARAPVRREQLQQPRLLRQHQAHADALFGRECGIARQ